MKPRRYTEGRRPAITEKIARETTGLNGSLFVHVEFDDYGRIDSVTFSEKSKDGSTLDTILAALGDTVTGIIRDAKLVRDEPVT